MSKARSAEPEVTQDEPTRPVERDEAGRVLDAHGLPVSGPARLAALDGRPDPRDATPPSDPADANPIEPSQEG
jgi:hypothetical protein